MGAGKHWVRNRKRTYPVDRPVDYKGALAEAVDLLVAAKSRSLSKFATMYSRTSVWPYAAQSISDWKNAFALNASDVLRSREALAFSARAGRGEAGDKSDPL